MVLEDGRSALSRHVGRRTPRAAHLALYKKGSFMLPFCLLRDLPILQELQAFAVEILGMLGLHPMAATVEQDEACIRAAIENFHSTAHGIEAVFSASETQHRALDLA